MMPLSASNLWSGRSLRARLDAVVGNGVRGRRQQDLLYMAGSWWVGPNEFQEAVRRSLAAQARPYLAFALRSDRALETAQWQRIERRLEQLLGLQDRWPLVFCTPDEAMERLGLAAAPPSAADRLTPGAPPGALPTGR
jgi:hypothetical protein